MARILVIDDEKIIVFLFKEILESDGYRVTGVSNAEEGIELFNRESFDLVITDIVMPGKSGLEVIQEIKFEHPDAKIIATNSLEPVLMKAEECGADGLLRKPFDVCLVRNMVRELLRREGCLSK